MTTMKSQIMRDLLDAQDAFGNVGLPHSAKLLSELRSSPKKWEALNFLRAKGHIAFTLDTGKALVNIHIEDSGLTYFEDRRAQIQEFWLKSVFVPVIISVLTTFVMKAFSW